MRDYHTGMSPADLTAFVHDNFDLPQDLPWDAALDRRTASLVEAIQAIWPKLTRPPMTADTGSRLAFPFAHVVPGGRFREIYYWDTYFTMLGLAADGQHALNDAMTAGFADLIDRYGFIPNGTRSYYLGRSQPPVFYLMMQLSAAPQSGWWQALRKEYAFWMTGERVVTMPDGVILNRYWDADDTPRDEGWSEDRALDSARRRDVRAAAESGWDFSARWFADGRTLKTIHTTQVVPCDLNALLYGMENALGLKEEAARRQAAMTRWLWNDIAQWWCDWRLDTGTQSAVLSAAGMVPLFTGLASSEQAASVAERAARDFLAPGGFRTSLVETGQQWDVPNGWAPLQWFAAEGLRRYGYADLADEIARRWCQTVEKTYQQTGIFFEKYDLEKASIGAGGEYPNQSGFGWTNGVTRAFLDQQGRR